MAALEMTERILSIVFSTVEAINPQLAADQRLGKQPETVLIGEKGVLDSLGFINFLTSLEANLSESLGKPIKLLDESLMVDTDGPYRTIGSLVNYVATQLK
jgi:acyl carrier protein